MGLKTFDFKYKVEMKKEIRLTGYNSPHNNTKEAELDIIDAVDFFDIKNKLQEGLNSVEFTVKYVEQSDKSFIPYYSDLKMERIEKENPLLKELTF
jgi:hypothetical protein